MGRALCSSGTLPFVPQITHITKDDASKPRYSLIPWKAMRTVVAALEYGARKYAPDNWRKIDEGETRYKEAAMRHLAAVMEGESVDQESGLPHLAHVIVSCLFSLELASARGTQTRNAGQP